jgi:4-hydroxy-3-polyprenylbenzoate decarboxylase
MPGRPRRIVVAITGASGAGYAKRVIELLAAREVEVHLAVTPFGRRLLHDELGMETVDPADLSGGRADRVVLHRDRDAGAAIASGSFEHDGMVIVPCSSNTMGSIAAGVTQNLVHRAALVCLKERRKLIVAHREMPLSSIDIENMDRLTRAGAIIAPLSPGFYMLPKTVTEVIDFVAGRLVDLLGVGHDLPVRWTGSTPDIGAMNDE